ncbi:Synaptobrevin-like protein YKT6 [Aphelenchoides besseyi]|nr:Synaptobrevin-like protein YKT6 [Aphelenchoides besseyi]
MWIRPQAGRNKKRYARDDLFRDTSTNYVTCTQEQCEMLDKLMTPFWLRRKHYVDDPYEPYHVRRGITSPRVDYKGRLEFMLFTGRLLCERSEAPCRNTITQDEYKLRVYARTDKLTGVCVSDQEYEERVAYTLLSKVLDEFTQQVPAATWPMIREEKDCNFSKLPEFLTKWQNPREADSLMRVQDEVEETKNVLHKTMKDVLERGERLDDLVTASENLSDQSKMFYTQARKMNKCCNLV